MTNIKVNVNLTQNHIYHGDAGECGSCPAALAILDALPGTQPDVEGRHIRLHRGTIGGKSARVDTPQAVRNFIKDFDDGLHVEPFTFELTVPDWAVWA